MNKVMFANFIYEIFYIFQIYGDLYLCVFFFVENFDI